MYMQVEFTREALYTLVWERPVLAIAKDVGVSDVALAKACRKAGIPLPSRGHWAIINAGRTVKTPALPALKTGQPATVSFSVLANPPPEIAKPVLPMGPSIKIPTILNKPHPLVAELKAAAKVAEEDKGVLALNYGKVLRVRTSISQLKRALILVDTLIKQVEKRGYRVRVSEERPETELVLNEGVISFRLDERTTKTTPPALPPRPSGRRGDQSHAPWRPTYVLVGTGEFTLEFGRYALRKSRTSWKDRANRSLEAQLSEIIATIPAWEAALLASRLERVESEARLREAENHRILIAREQEVLRLQRLRLVGNLRAWERAERLRSFIAAVEHASRGSAEARTWSEWARTQAYALDPLSEIEVITDLNIELSKYFTPRGSWEKPVSDWWT